MTLNRKMAEGGLAGELSIRRKKRQWGHRYFAGPKEGRPRGLRGASSW